MTETCPKISKNTLLVYSITLLFGL